MLHTITITETLRKNFTIEADTLEDAIEIAKDKYYREQLILTADDIVDTEFSDYDISDIEL